MFFTRLLSSIVLVLVALVTLLRGGYLLAAVLLLISLVAYRELCKACNLNMDAEEKSVNALEAAGYAGIVVYYGIVVFSSSQAAQMLSILFVMIGMMFVYVFTFPKYQASQVMASAEPTTPPIAPSMDFFGLSLGVILCFPIIIPVRLPLP